MKIVLYARVSSEKQAEKDLSLPAQLKALRDYAIAREWTIVHEYVDAAESARSADRPQFQEMIAKSKQKNPEFQAILVWKLNRFARNREDSIVFKSLLRKKGIQVISINEKFEDNATGKLMEAIVEAMDEFYSANLAQDTVRGMRENASRGFWNGGREPYGYKVIKVEVGKNQKNKLVVVPHEAEVVKRIFMLCFHGQGVKAIGKTLNNDNLRRRNGKPWNTSTIGYILKNETYTGTVVWRDHKKKNEPIRKVDAHEAIVPQHHYLRAQSLLATRTRFAVPPAAVTSDHLLSSMLRCKKCGSSMASCAAKSGRYRYYTCQRYIKMGPEYCRHKLISADKLDAFMIKTLQERILTEDNLRDLFRYVNEEAIQHQKTFQSQIASMSGRLDELREKRRNLYTTIESGKLDHSDIAPRLKEINEEIEGLTVTLDKLQGQGNTATTMPITDEEMKPYVDDLRESLMKGEITERKSFLRTFIKAIRIDYPALEIEYTIPIPVPNKETPSAEEVLCFNQIGSPNRILYISRRG